MHVLPQTRGGRHLTLALAPVPCGCAAGRRPATTARPRRGRARCRRAARCRSTLCPPCCRRTTPSPSVRHAHGNDVALHCTHAVCVLPPASAAHPPRARVPRAQPTTSSLISCTTGLASSSTRRACRCPRRTLPTRTCRCGAALGLERELHHAYPAHFELGGQKGSERSLLRVQVALLRQEVGHQFFFTSTQVIRVMSCFAAGPHKVEVAVMLYALLIDRKNFWQIMYRCAAPAQQALRAWVPPFAHTLTLWWCVACALVVAVRARSLRPLEQGLLMWRLGPHHVFDRTHPSGHYILDLSNPAHEQVRSYSTDGEHCGRPKVRPIHHFPCALPHAHAVPRCPLDLTSPRRRRASWWRWRRKTPRCPTSGTSASRCVGIRARTPPRHAHARTVPPFSPRCCARALVSACRGARRTSWRTATCGAPSRQRPSRRSSSLTSLARTPGRPCSTRRKWGALHLTLG